MQQLTYRDHSIHCDPSGGLISLTDCWRAAGSPSQLRPAQWLRLPGPQTLIKYVEKNLSVLHTASPGAKPTQIVTSKIGGTSSGTWAHWHIALAYIQDLSPAFRAWASEQLQTVFSPEVPVSVLPSPHLVEGSGQLERHLKKLHDSGYLPGREAADIMSAVLEKIWGIALPRCLGTTPRKPGSRAVLSNKTGEPPAPTVVEAVAEPELKQGERKVSLAVGEGETAFKASELPPNTYTGNGAAFYLDKIDNGIFTRWLHHKRGSGPDVQFSRDSYGREFNALARELGFHPLPAKGYTPPPEDSVCALKVEAPAARTTGDKGTVGVGTRTTAVFTTWGIHRVLSHIREGLKLPGYSTAEFFALRDSTTDDERALAAMDASS